MVEFTITGSHHGQRADVFLATQFPEFTRSALSHLFDGRVRVGGKKVKAGYKLRTNEILQVDNSSLDIKIPDIELPIMFEDEDVIVINKPAGVLTHAKGGINQEATVASFIAQKINFEIINNKSGIVHRLDRATSGVIICAKNIKSQLWLQKQFSLRKVRKVYFAVVSGKPDLQTALIDAPILRNPQRPQTFIVQNSGKPAQTIYTIIQSTADRSLLKLEPITGRTHQLRVHLKYIGHPIIGDYMYDGSPNDRLLLHAAELELTLPSKERKIFNAIVPKEFSL